MDTKAAHRNIVHHFQHLSNFRDIGGLATVDGRTFKAGVLFRSDELSRLTESEHAKLQELDIKVICDLRTLKESQKKPTRLPSKSTRVVNVPMHAEATHDGNRKKLLGFLFGRTGGDRFRDFSREYYHHMAFECTSGIREIICLVSEEQNLPALIHCNAGKDRTGFLAAIIQLFVGIPYETVMADYLRTNDHFGARLEKLIKVMRVLTLFSVSRERMRLILMAHPEFMNEVHEKIIQKHGSIENYLCEACELDQVTLAKLKNQLLS